MITLNEYLEASGKLPYMSRMVKLQPNEYTRDCELVVIKAFPYFKYEAIGGVLFPINNSGATSKTPSVFYL